ncbi:hypothetical protein GGS24DRAFT_261671 [Hypoxylon argillaceum]|nr:hypothetical protein GGS24DRAFT_261671 [Hypoxylon argillaceum]
MPRILPWKRREGDVSGTPNSTRSSPVQHVKRDDAERVRDETNSALSPDVGSTTKKTVKRPRRSTSTSPPPAPPQEKSMIEGIDGDDRYRMVEDEFLATAQQFTAHLHAAEYKRLKAASELENAQMIKNISRPVVGRMTDLVSIKRDRKTLAEKQRLAARRLRNEGASGDESTGTDDVNNPWQKQSLYGLMESPGKRARRADALPSATPVTRAAAGYHRQKSDAVSPSVSKSKTSSDFTRHLAHESEDDLDVPKTYSVANRIPQPVFTPSRVAESKARDVEKPPLGESSKTTRNPQHHQQETSENTIVSDDEGMDFVTRLKKRQEERRRSRGQRKSTNTKGKSDHNDILPDFL